MTRFVATAVFSFAVLCAALLSHVLLDVVGDYWLARDAYDGIAHASRGTVFSAALGLAVVVLWRVLAAAVRDLEGQPGAVRGLLRGAAGPSPWRFVAGVALVSVPVLAAMGALDGLLDARDVDSLAECLGGSVPLGVSVSLVCALVVGALVWRLGRFLGRLDSALLRLVESFVHFSRRPRRLVYVRRERAPIARLAVMCVARSLGLRAPPSPARC